MGGRQLGLRWWEPTESRSRSGRCRLRGAFVGLGARPGTSGACRAATQRPRAGTSRVAGGRVALALGRARVEADAPASAHAISRGTSSVTAPAWTHPSSGAVRGEGGHPRAGAKAGAPPGARSRQSTESPARAGLPAGGRTVRRCATSVGRAPARRYAKAMAVDFALRARRLPVHDAARVRVSRFSEHPNEPGGGRRSAHTPRTREWARGRARAPMARCGEALA